MPRPTPVILPPTLKCSLEPTAITVGQKMSLKCETELVPSDPAKIQFVDASSNKPFTLQFLSSPRFQGKSFEQDVTSYRVGSHEISNLRVKIDGAEFLVSRQNIQVNSVIQAPSPTPIPIVDPVSVPAPWWWWAIWAGVALILMGYVVRELIKWNRERHLKKNMVPEKELTPAEKFDARLRKLESQGLHVKGSYKAFALELTMILKQSVGAQLKFPAEDLTSEELMVILEKSHKNFFKNGGNQLRSLLSDLDQIKFAKIETTMERCVTLLDLAKYIGKVLFEVPL